MKITAIKQQVKNPERVSIFIDAKYALSLTMNQLLEEQLRVGQEVDAERLAALKRLSDEGKLRGRALQWVMTRQRSQKELRDYLWRKKASAELSEAIMDYFIAKGYINDQTFAEQWIMHRRQSKHRSNRILKQELQAKGVDREIIDELLSGSQTDETNALQELIVKKKRQTRYAQDDQKLIQYLLRQGYSYDQVKRQLSGEVED